MRWQERRRDAPVLAPLRRQDIYSNVSAQTAFWQTLEAISAQGAKARNGPNEAAGGAAAGAHAKMNARLAWPLVQKTAATPL